VGLDVRKVWTAVDGIRFELRYSNFEFEITHRRAHRSHGIRKLIAARSGSSIERWALGVEIPGFSSLFRRGKKIDLGASLEFEFLEFGDSPGIRLFH